MNNVFKRINLNLTILIYSILSILVLPIVASANNFVGTHECGPYSLRDTRPQTPKAKLSQISLSTRGSGYVLKVLFNDERGQYDIPLDHSLYLLSNKRSTYTNQPMKILSNGKFNFTVLTTRQVCTYSGIAKISPEAFRKLFSAK